MKRTKGVFFDLDGVIINSSLLWDHIIRTIVEKYDLRTELLNDSDGHNLSTEEAIRTILERSSRFSEPLYDEILKYIDVIYAENFINMTSLYKGCIDTLNWLSENKTTLILVSNSSAKQVDIILNYYNLGKYFKYKITSTDVKKGKPDKEPYIKALALSGLQKGEVVVIEDSMTGVNSAIDAQLDYIIIGESTKDGKISIDKLLIQIKKLVD